MTTSYLSFGSLATLHNNSLLVTSPIGELSNKARTYAKDPGVFSSDKVGSETVLYNFLSQTDNVDIVMPEALANVQIDIGDWLYAQSKLGNITSNRPNTLALMTTTFTDKIVITDIGEMVTNNVVWFPSFVQGTHIVGSDKQPFLLWFADEYFRSQYPKVSFTVVHPLPLTEIDSLLTLNYQQLQARFAKETPDVIEKRVQALTQGAAWPYTNRGVERFAVLDIINTPNLTNAYWHFMEWGNGADAEDQLYDQIKAEILAASDHPESEWEEKVPDLFNPLEFYVLPYFNRLGVVNKTNGASSMSPIVDRETMMALVDKYLTPNMTPAHVIKSMQVVPFIYKSFACAFVAKLNNRPGMEKVTATVPDYQLIPSSDSSMDLMSAATMEFVRQMENLLAAAEIVTSFSLIPAGVTRVTRFNKLYVAARINKVKYLVMTRAQMVDDDIVEE